ncbi:ATP-binding cassette domain-containing protein [Candidatus Bipolaricaulota bacterium]|nr:ATP-binding cassette domain-containing protein [Candidatus Bipolaricaulota bacterium]
MLLELKKVEKGFAEVKAVQGVSFQVARGEILGLLGPNGAGKTTLIRMIMGIFRPDRGEILFHFDGKAGPLVKERVGYLPEERGLYEDARVIDLLVYFAELKGIPRVEGRSRAMDWLGRLELGEWARRKVEKLSKGMQQKVQFIAAVLHEPDLVVLDEPFAGLDPVNQDLFRELILELKSNGAAIILSSHRMDLVEDLCDRIFLIHRGREVLYGPLPEVKALYGGYVVQLRFRGPKSLLEGLEGVEESEINDGFACLSLSRGIDPEAFLRAMPAGLGIEEFAIRRPTLHEIFVSAVKGA